jgi:enediyne biosynthesis protein E3
MIRLVQKFLRIPEHDVSFSHRGFWSGNPSAREHLERIGEMFLEGYHAALEDDGTAALCGRLNQIEAEFRGYGFEGAAMSLDLLDQIAPRRESRIQALLAGPGAPHLYMIYVGIGWSMARWRLRIQRRLSQLDSVLGWLTFDGRGFHEGFFHWSRCAAGKSPRGLRGYSSRAFDQGLGRSLWFVGCADVEYIGAAIAQLPPDRHGDLWGGVGLACAYAGGVESEEIMRLGFVAGPYWPHVAQGAAFAAKARQRAGNWCCHTDLACRIIGGLSAERAAALTDRALQQAVARSEPAYEVWRGLIRAHFLSQDNMDGTGVKVNLADLRGEGYADRDGSLQ